MGILGIHWIIGTRVNDCSHLLCHIYSVLIFQFLGTESLETCVILIFSALSFFDVLLVSGNNTPLTIVVVMQLQFANAKLLTINSKTALVLAGFGKVWFSPHRYSLTDSATRVFRR